MQRRLYPGMAGLLAFDALARTGGFTAAARDLSLTQGAVSRQVAQLEAQLGVQLVTREGRGARLTEAGAAYARQARVALEALGAGAMAALGQGDDTSLHLAIVPTFGTRWLMPRIPRFLRRHPEVTLHFATRIGPFDMAAERIDAAITAGRGDWPGMRMTLLIGETVVPVAAPALAMRDWADMPLLGLQTRPDAWRDWWRDRGLAGQPPTPAMRFEQVSTLAQATVAGMGAALLPAFLIRPELDSGALVVMGEGCATGFGYYFAEPVAGSKKTVAQLREWLVTETDRDVLV